MLPTIKRLAVLLLLAAGLPACATITTGTSQSVSVLTDPSGANCSLTRDGSVIGVVNPTPGTVTISKSARAISVNCTRPGNLPGIATHNPQFQAMTVGNLLIGGIIGVGIDAASGALSYYPDSLTVALPPETFDSELSRVGFFIRRAADVRRIYDERISAVNTACSPAERLACDGQIQALGRERDDELRRLEEQRHSARAIS